MTSFGIVWVVISVRTAPWAQASFEGGSVISGGGVSWRFYLDARLLLLTHGFSTNRRLNRDPRRKRIDFSPGWRTLAGQAAHESDSTKLMRIIQDLCRALDRHEEEKKASGRLHVFGKDYVR